MVLTKDSRASVRLIKISSPLAPSIRSLMIPSKCCHPFVVPVQLACPIKSWSPNWYLTSCVHVLQAGANQVVPQAVCRPADDGINMHEPYISNPQSRVRIKTYKDSPRRCLPSVAAMEALRPCRNAGWRYKSTVMSGSFTIEVWAGGGVHVHEHYTWETWSTRQSHISKQDPSRLNSRIQMSTRRSCITKKISYKLAKRLRQLSTAPTLQGAASWIANA